MGTFGGGDGDDIVDELDDEVVEVAVADDGLLRGGAGGGVIGSTFTLQSLEFRFGEMRAGKLSVFVHWDKLRTMVNFFAAGTQLLLFTSSFVDDFKLLPALDSL